MFWKSNKVLDIFEKQLWLYDCRSIQSKKEIHSNRKFGSHCFCKIKKPNKNFLKLHSLRVGWRNLCLFPVVLLCNFFLAVNRFWFYILLMYLEYHKVVVFCMFFWFWREIVFGVMYILSSLQYSCAVVSVFWRKIGFSVTYLCT